MRTRFPRFAYVLAPLISLFGWWTAPVHATTTVQMARAVTVISGSAGNSTLLRLSRPATLNNAGRDVELSAPGSMAAGVGLVRIDHRQRYSDQSFYIESYGTDLGMCDGSPCPVPIQVRAYVWGAQDTGPIRLSAGDYLVVLLAESGTHVTAHLRLHGEPTGALQSTASGARLGHMTMDLAAGSVGGRDLVARGYHVHYARASLFVGNMGMFSFASPGTLDYQNCSDFGDGPPPDGPTPCAGGGSVAPSPVVAVDDSNTVVGTGAAFAFGPPNGHYNLGYTIAVSGPDPSVQRIRVADYQLVLGQ